MKEKRKQTKKKKTNTEKSEGDKRCSERVCSINMQSFFNFYSNLELALSIILTGRELYEPKHVAVECRCLKKWDLLSFFIYSSILVLK